MPGLKKLASKLSMGRTSGDDKGLEEEVQPRMLHPEWHALHRRDDSDNKNGEIASKKRLKPFRRRRSSLSSCDSRPSTSDGTASGVNSQSNTTSKSAVRGLNKASVPAHSFAALAASSLVWSQSAFQPCEKASSASQLASPSSRFESAIRAAEPASLAFNSETHQKPGVQSVSLSFSRYIRRDKDKSWIDEPESSIQPRLSDVASENSSWKNRTEHSNPLREAAFAQIRWASRQELPDDAEPVDDDSSVHSSDLWGLMRSRPRPQRISDINWADFTDVQAKDYMNHFAKRGSQVGSPVDSALGGMSESEASSVGKGKGRAKDASRGAQSLGQKPTDEWTLGATIPVIDLEAEANSLVRLAEEDESLRAEIERYQIELKQRHAEWDERLTAMKLQKEAALERIRQEEEDRKNAALERVRQEEEDHKFAQELEQQMRDEELRDCMRDCLVCGDSRAKDQFPARTPTSQCEHEPETCSECLTTWLDSEFSTKGADDWKCAQCPSTLTYTDIQRHASDATFAAYEKLLTRNALASDPDFAWCLASKCGSGQVNLESNGFMECVACKYKQCLKCAVPWHVGEKCAAYQYRSSGQKAKDEEAKTMAMLDSMSKKCPGPECGWRIQKVDGCDHMTCKRCKFQFCWECLCSFDEIKRVGNTAHMSWCKFHSDNLKVSWPFNMH